MSEHIEQLRRVSGNGVATRTTRVIDDDSTDDNVDTATPAEAESTSVAARVVWLIAGIIIAILAFRFVFVLLGANPANGFANFIYTLSHPFAAPFFGLFGYSLRYGVSRFELSTLVAMAVYALVAYGITKLLTIRQPQA